MNISEREWNDLVAAITQRAHPSPDNIIDIIMPDGSIGSAPVGGRDAPARRAAYQKRNPRLWQATRRMMDIVHEARDSVLQSGTSSGTDDDEKEEVTKALVSAASCSSLRSNASGRGRKSALSATSSWRSAPRLSQRAPTPYYRQQPGEGAIISAGSSATDMDSDEDSGTVEGLAAALTRIAAARARLLPKPASNASLLSAPTPASSRVSNASSEASVVFMYEPPPSPRQAAAGGNAPLPTGNAHGNAHGNCSNVTGTVSTVHGGAPKPKAMPVPPPLASATPGPARAAAPAIPRAADPRLARTATQFSLVSLRGNIKTNSTVANNGHVSSPATACKPVPAPVPRHPKTKTKQRRPAMKAPGGGAQVANVRDHRVRFETPRSAKQGAPTVTATATAATSAGDTGGAGVGAGASAGAGAGAGAGVGAGAGAGAGVGAGAGSAHGRRCKEKAGSASKHHQAAKKKRHRRSERRAGKA